MQGWDRLRGWLGRRVDGSALGLFRIAWGALMVGEAIRKFPKATGIYSPDYFHFKYALFPFVEPLPTNALVQGEIVAMGLAGLAIMLGVGLRPAALLYALISAHLFLVEKLYYNNHFYLTILLNALLAATRADACYSLRAWWARRSGAVPDPTAPFWNLALLRGQTVIVYFFGGIAKLNADWFQGEPVRHWLRQNPAGPPLSWVLTEEWFVQLVAYGGLVFDLAIGFLLLGRRTFWLAVPFVVGFHVTNDQLFRIGLFPWIGISLCLVFLEPSWPRRAAAWLRARLGRPVRGPTGVAQRPGRASTATVAFVVGYLAFQALWPLRIHLLEGNPSWTEVGHNFSWRMMLRDKDGWAKFLFDPPEAERLLEQTDQLPKIGVAHLQRMVKTPHFILQYAHELDRTLAELGMPDVEIRALSVASLNGRPYQLMIDPTVDLTEAAYGFFEVPSWIVPVEKFKRPGQYPRDEEERLERIARAIEQGLRERGLPATFAR